MSAPAASSVAVRPLPLSDERLEEGFREATRQVRNYVRTVSPYSPDSYTTGFKPRTLPYGSRFLYIDEPDIDAAVLAALTSGLPASQEFQTLATCIRTLAMCVEGIYRVSHAGYTQDTGFKFQIEAMLDTRDAISWNTPDAVRRLLLRVVPRDAMSRFIENPDGAWYRTPGLRDQMRATRADEANRASMEIAMLARGEGMPRDVAQMLAQRVAPTAVTRERPLRLLTSNAQRERDAQRMAQLAAQDALDPLVQAHRAAAAAAPTHTDVLDEILAEFDDTDADTLKRKLIDLRDSLKRQRR